MARFARLILAFLLLATAVLVVLFVNPVNPLTVPPTTQEVHKHADFKVFLEGIEIGFAKEKYMSTNAHPKSLFVHLHDLNGNIIHQHAAGIILGDFFYSFGMKFTSDCFETDTGEKYCNFGDKTLKFFVNGKPNYEFENYEFNDLDRLLISFGNESPEQLKAQIDSVTDEACIQSGKCPERGQPSDESTCTTALGCIA